MPHYHTDFNECVLFQDLATAENYDNCALMDAPTPQRRVTVRDIARRLGVSHTTVSRALRDDPRISSDLRNKIHGAAVEMGYRPDPMLTALAHYRRAKIPAPIRASLAWINCWPNPKHLHTFRELDLYWRGAKEQAEQAGYRLEPFNCPKDLSPERLQQILQTRNIEGLLLTPAWARVLPDWRGLDWENFSVVRFGYSLESPTAHLVTSAQMFDGRIAYENIWSKGYRRIGLVYRENTQALFRAGYLLADVDLNHGKHIAPLVLAPAEDPSSRLEQKHLREWLRKYRPDAILTDLRDVPAWLANAGHRVPEDVALASFSVLDGMSDAGINQNSLEIGRVAIQLLISLIHHNERGIPNICREVQIEGFWVDGRTLPNAQP
jgi:DNA-binding LacI/PurR family transcriptional regulator